jgi:hypothetical protein
MSNAKELSDQPKNKKRAASENMIEEFLRNISGIEETNIIYQDIVDAVYKKEIEEIANDEIFMQNLAI